MYFLHPFVVHFAIALLAMAVITDIIYLLTKKEHLRQTVDYLLGVGTVFAVLAVLSGMQAQEVAIIPAGTQALVQDHEFSGKLTLALFALICVLRLMFRRWKPGSNALRWVYYLVSIAGLVMLLRTGLMGGQMVYIHGVGLEKNQAPQLEKPSFEH